MDKLLAKLHARVAQLEQEIFSSPPATMEEFCKRQGRWLEASDLLEELTLLAKGLEDDLP